MISLLGLPFVVNAGACSADPPGGEGDEAIALARMNLNAPLQPCPDTAPAIYCGHITVAADASCHGFGALPITQTCNIGSPLTCLQGLHAGDVPSILQSAPPGPYSLGTTTAVPVTCTASGVQASCKESVTVVDLTGPVITCPGNQVLTCTSMLAAGTGATATDNCGVAPPTCDHALDVPFPDGTTTVTCTAVDGSGNASSCSFDVTVAPDSTAPAISCPSNQTFECSGTLGVTATANDACGSATVECTPPVGTVFPLGSEATGHCTATDAAGNSSSCDFLVAAVDTTAPQITCPGDQDLGCNGEATMPSAMDSCGGPTPVYCSSSSLSSTVTAYSCTATDGSGNVSPACSFKVTKGSQSAPGITVGTPVVQLWPPNHKYAFDLGACGLSAVDGCGVSSPVDSTNAHIDRITSDEPEDANGLGDGHTCNDIVLGSDGYSATLRAERDGGASHNGRVYTVWFTVQDSSGHASQSSCRVEVPHDQAQPVVKDACQLCVGTGCGTCPGHDASCDY